MKFAPKLTVLFVGIGIVVASIMFVLIYFQVAGILDDEIGKRMENRVIFTMDALDRFLSRSLNDIKIIANDPVISSESSTAEQITERLIFYRNTYKWYVSLSFFNLERARIADSSGLMIGRKNRITRYWEDVLSGQVSAASDVHISESLKAPVVYFASSVKNKEGKTIGVVAARILINRLFEMVEENNSFQKESAAVTVIPARNRLFEMVAGNGRIQGEEKIDIVDKDGILIYSNHNRERILKENLEGWESIKRAHQGEIYGSAKHRHLGEEETFYTFCHEQGYLDFKGNGWTIIYHMPTRVIFKPAYDLLKILIIMFLIMLSALSIIIYFFSKTVTRPLALLSAAAEEIGRGNLGVVIEVKSKDEFGSLSDVINQMARHLKKSYAVIEAHTKELEEKVAQRTKELEDLNLNLEIRIKDRTAELTKSQKAMLYMIEDLNRQAKELKDAQDKLVRSEKLAVIGQLASSVAHELRNPLGVMKNVVYYFNMMGLGKDNAEIKDNLDILAKEIEGSNKIIGDLLEFSRIKKPALRLEKINVIVKEILNRLKAPENISIITELADNLPDIEVDALQIQQVFYNLALNAIQAMEKGGALTIKTGFIGGNIEISFVDTGCGIPKENIDKIFNPLFSTKTKGTGLGLSVCASLVEGHKGKIEVESEEGKGAAFIVKLPVN